MTLSSRSIFTQLSIEQHQDSAPEYLVRMVGRFGFGNGKDQEVLMTCTVCSARMSPAPSA